MQVLAPSFPGKNPMRAFILHGKEDLRRGELPTPVAQLGHVLVHARRVGICGSDVPYSLHDTRILDLLPFAREKGIGLINASPFGSGLLTDRGPADWHPANAEQRAIFKQAAEFCTAQGTNISKLALQFSSQNPDIPTTMFSSASAESVKRNVARAVEPFDPTLVTQVRQILNPITHIDWS